MWGGGKSDEEEIALLEQKLKISFVIQDRKVDKKVLVFLTKKKNLIQNLLEFKEITDTLAVIKLKLRKITLTIIQIYAPTVKSEKFMIIFAKIWAKKRKLS